MSQHTLAIGWLCCIAASVIVTLVEPEPKRPWTRGRTLRTIIAIPASVFLYWLVADAL